MTPTAGSEHQTAQPPRTRHLIRQVAWFNRLRFAAAGGMVLFTTAGGLLGILGDTVPLYVLAALTLVLNGFYVWEFRHLARATHNRVRRHANVQIGLDLLILTGVLRYSGGSASPFAFFFVFHTFIATQMVSVRMGLLVALASLGLVACLGVLEWSGSVPAVDGFRLLDPAGQGGLGLFVWLLALGLTLGISVYFVSTVLHEVRSRDEELRRLNLQLGQSEKLASIGTLAAGVAHEINNPVGVIRNKAQILRYRIEDGEESSALLAELDTIERHADRIGTITGGLLTFSKEQPFELRPVDLNKLAREAAALVRVPFDEQRVELRLKVGEWPVWVPGSENHLLQVLVNILLNARDASSPGDQVRLSVAAEDGVGSIRIQDEGTGIAPGDLGSIFDPFFTTKDVDRGTGLGLAITHGIVERHQGKITVQTQVGEGTTFQVDLPMQP